MLKNKIIVRKIRNILILLMAILIMIGAYKNIDKSKAENVIEISAIAIDNYGYLEQEELTLEAREIENDLYEIEIPELANSKKINKIVKCILENEVIELTEDNKIELTKTQLEKGQIHIEVAYDVALVETKEQGEIEKILLSEKTEEERKQIEITENMQTLYNKILKYEDEGNGKLVEVKGYLPQNARLHVEEVAQKQLTEIFKDIKIDVAYDIKILVDVKTQVPADEANPDAKPEEIIETIEINPKDLGETCEVTIKDTNIVANSQVYHVKEDNTYEKVDVKESIDKNIIFEAQTFSIYAVSSASKGLIIGVGGTVPDVKDSTVGTVLMNPISKDSNSSISVLVSIANEATIAGYTWSSSSTIPTGFQTDGAQIQQKSYSISTEGAWYLHVKASDGAIGTGGPYRIDKTAPTYTIDSPATSTWSKSKTITVTCMDRDSAYKSGLASSSVQYTWKDSNGNSAGSGTASGSAGTRTITKNNLSGQYNLEMTITVTDVAGNSITETVTRGPYYFDNTSPAVPTYTPFYTSDNTTYTSGTYTNKEVSTTFSATDGHSGVQKIQYSKDKTTWSDLISKTTGSKTFSGTEPWTLRERDDSYYFRAVDAVGNVSAATSTAFNIKYDLTAPTTPEMEFVYYDFTPYTQGNWTNTWVYVAQNTWSDPGPKSTDNSNEFQSGVAKYEISTDGTTWVTYDYSQVNDNLALYRMDTSGIHTRNFRAIDNAGNISEVTTRTAMIDMNKPKITINTQGNQNWEKTHTAEVTISDELSGLAEGGSIKYGWSLYTTTQPTDWQTTAISSHSAGTSSVTFSITENRKILTGKYYLWILPADDNSLKDVAGNIGATTAISTEKFWFDNQVPMYEFFATEDEENDWKNYLEQEIEVYVKAWDMHSGIRHTENNVEGETPSNVRFRWYKTENPDNLESSLDSSSEKDYTKVETVGNTDYFYLYKEVKASDDDDQSMEGIYYLGAKIWAVDMPGKASDANVLAEYECVGPFYIDNVPPTAGTLIRTIGDSLGSDNYHTTTSGVSDGWTKQNVTIGIGTQGSDGNTDAGNYVETRYTVYNQNSDGTYSIYNELENQDTTTTLTETGIYKIVVTTKDCAENITTNEYSVKIDKTIPTMGVEPTSAIWRNSALSVTVTHADAGGSGLASTSGEYFLSTNLSPTTKPTGSTLKGTYTTSGGTATISINPKTSGEYYLYLKQIEDKATNKSSTTDYVTIGGVVYHRYGLYQFDYDKPTITVQPDSTEWRNRALSVEIKHEDTGGSGLASTSREYFLSTNPSPTTKPTGSTLRGTYTTSAGTATISINPQTSGEYYLWVKQIEDNATNKSSTTDYVTIGGVVYHRYGSYKFDYDEPTITVQPDSTEWRNSAVSVRLTHNDTGGSGVEQTDGEYFLSTSTSPGTVPTEGTHKGTYLLYMGIANISVNPGTSGQYYLYIKQIADIATNKSDTTNYVTIGGEIYHRFGPYQFDYDWPKWEYVSKDIYYSTANDAGNDDYANRERTIKITFKGTDATSNITSGLTANDIEISVNNGEPITSGITKTLTTVSTADKEIVYTLTLKGIEGDGVLKIELPSGTLTDLASNTNVFTDMSMLMPSITIDNTPPELSFAVISPVTIPETENYYKAGTEIKITATYNEDIYKEITSNTLITTANPPAMTLKFGGATSKNTVQCTPESGRVFTYTYTITGPTTAGGTDGDNGTMTISMETVFDRAGNAISASDVTPSPEITADTIEPTLTVEPPGCDWRNLALNVTVTHEDLLGSGFATTSGQYFLTTSDSPTAIPTESTLTGTYTTSGGVGNITIDPQISGEYYLWVKQIEDKAGNTSSTTNFVKINGITYHRSEELYKFDYTAPTYIGLNAFYSSDRSEYHSGTWTNDAKGAVHTEITASDDHSGVAYIQYREDSEPEDSWHIFDFTAGNPVGLQETETNIWSGTEEWGISERDDNYYFKIVDNAGNEFVTSSAVWNIRYDLTAPTIPTYTAFHPSDNISYTSGTWTNYLVHSTISATDASSTSGVGSSGVSVIQYSTDKTTWNTFDFTAGNPVGLQETGTNIWSGTEEWELEGSDEISGGRNDSYYFRSIDVAGNISSVSSTPDWNIKYDLTKPSPGSMAFKNADGTTYTPGSTNWTNQNVNLTLTNGTDSGNFVSGHQETTYTINGETSTATSLTTEGTHIIEITTKDNAGNVSDKQSYTINIDKHAPTIEVNTTSCSYRNSALTGVTITVEETGGSGLASGNLYQYYLSSEPDSLSGGTWEIYDYTGETPITINPGTSRGSGAYFLFIRRIEDNAGNASTSNGEDVTVSSVDCHKYGEYYFDYDKPTITVQPDSAEWRNSELDLIITHADTGGSGVATISGEYFLTTSDSPTEIPDTLKGTYTTSEGTATIGINPGTSGEYYLWAKRIEDNATNKSDTTPFVTIGEEIYHRFGPYQFDYDLPEWEYVSKDIYLGNPDDVGNVENYDGNGNRGPDEYANKDRTIKITFKGTDATSKITSTLTANDIAISVNDTPITYTITKILDIVSTADKEIVYTLTLKGIEGDGVLKIELPSGTLTDLASNTNAFTNMNMLMPSITIDNTPPELSFAVTSPVTIPETENYYKAGQVITITATYSDTNIGAGIFEDQQSTIPITTENAPAMSLAFGNTDAQGDEPECIDVDGNVLTYTYTIKGPTTTGGTDGDNGILKITSLGTVYDAAGNSIELPIYPVTPTPEITADTIAPTLTIEQDKTSWTNAETITYTFTFSENVTGFTAADITLISTQSKASKGIFSGSGSIYTLEVNTVDAYSETVTVSIPANVCTDLAILDTNGDGVSDDDGNENMASSSLSINIDRIDPTITVTPDKTTNATANNYQKSQSVTITVADEGAGLLSTNSYQYFLSSSSTSLSGGAWTGGTWTDYDPTGVTPITIGEGLTGDYYLFVKTVKDNVTDTDKNISSSLGNMTAISGYHMFGIYKFDNTNPYWEIGTPSIDYTNKKVTVDIIGTDDHSGYGANSLDTGDIEVWVEGTKITNVNKELSTATTVAEGIKYTLTLTDFEEDARQTGKNYKEWSGSTKIVIAANTLEDNLANANTSDEYELGHIDIIDPEFTYQYSETVIDKTNKKLTVVFYAADKFLDTTNSGITLADFYNPNTDSADVLTTKPVFAVDGVPININVTGNSLTPETLDSGKTIKYTLVVANLQANPSVEENNLNDGYTYSGIVSIIIPADKFKDSSNNGNDATTITVGTDELDGEPNTGVVGGVVVDVVDPVWKVNSVALDTGVIKLQAIDKYFNTCTIDEDDITIIVNGEPSTAIVKDITSTTPTDITDTVNGVANTVVGKEYTLKLSNIIPGDGGYKIFTPTNLSELDESTRDGSYEYKYKSENGGDISIQIAAGTITDKSGNSSVQQKFDVGTVDVTNPEVYLVRKTQKAPNVDADNDGTIDPDANTETIVFNVTDRNYDYNDLVEKTEITLWFDNVQLDTLRNNSTLTYKEIWGVPEGTTTSVRLGHQYTLVIPNIAETVKQSGKDYLENSGTLKLTVATNAAKDMNSNNLEPDTTTITDFIDYLKPQIEQITVTNPINTSDKTYTMKFNVIDKYLDITNLVGIDTDSDGTIDDLNNELVIKVDGETASDITWQLTYESITVTMNKTVVRIIDGITSATVTNDSYTIGHTYTLVLSEFEQDEKQATKDFMEWSGTVTVEIAANAVNDKNGITNTVINYSDVKTLNGEHVDFIKPRLEKASSTRGTDPITNEPNETIVFNAMDKYLVVTDANSDGNAHETIIPSEITVYVDGEEVEVDYTNSSTTGLNGELTWVQDFKHTVNGNSSHIVGQQYQLVLSGFEQVSRNAKDYKDYSGTVTIEVAQTAVADTSGLTLDSDVDERTVKGDFVDFIKPQLEYVHSSSDINHGTKTYTMTFDITDKYYDDEASGNVLTLDDLTITMDSEYSGVDDFDLKVLATQGKVNIAFSDAEKTATFNKTVGGVVETTATEHVIGHTYTLTISNLDQLEIVDGDKTVNYSGIITVVVAQNQLSDTGPAGDGANPNQNVETEIVSGVDIPDGTGSGIVVDVVSPLFDKVSSSAYAFNPTNKASSIGTITFKATDRYFVEGSEIAADDIQIVVDGSVVSTGITKIFTDTEELTEDRIINGTPQNDVQYGIQYTLQITGWAQNAKQVKIRIPAEKLTDQYGNKNIVTDLIVYNCLELTSSEIGANSTFLDGNGLGETVAEGGAGSVTGIARQDIQQVIFVNSLSGSTATGVQKVWDVSAMTDGSIKAWTSQTSAPYTVYIGSDDEIFANQNSSYLFAHIGYGSSSTMTETITNIDSLNVKSVTNMASMFEGCGKTAMTTFSLGSNFNTSNVTNMSAMFKNFGQNNQASLALGTQFITNEVTNMSSMFEGCGTTAMTTLNLGSNFNTAKVTNMDSMFKNCAPNLTSIDLGSQFDTSIVTDMGSMFAGFGSISLTSLDLGNLFYTSKVTVTDMNNMFNGCGTTAMTVLDLGPAFTKISTAHTDFMKDCGTATLIIYAPESIYLNSTTLKTY